jgi:hypothetical protein
VGKQRYIWRVEQKEEWFNKHPDKIKSSAQPPLWLLDNSAYPADLVVYII